MPHHKHQHFHDKVKRVPVPLPDVTTENGVVMSVVYVTAEPTFTGVVGGYTTVTDASASQVTSSAAAAAAASNSNTSFSVVNLATVPSIISEESQSTATAVSAAGSNAVTTTQAASVTSTSVYSPSTSDSTDTSSASSTIADGDMSTAGKAGLAIGIIGGIGLMLAIILIVLAKKKKKQQHQEQNGGNDSEKNDHNNKSVVGKLASDAVDAPKLSLRPVSRLVSEFVGGAGPKNRLSQSHASNTRTSSAGFRTASPMLPFSEKSGSTDNPFQDPENPFADPARNHPAISELAAKGPDARSSGLAPMPAPLAVLSPRPESPIAPSPVISQGPGPEGSAPNVYRILIDFVPSMEDELELKSGQLVRLLHEYDDGWALCIRLDRSQQGVVPRTCLAAKPSKPRPGPGRESGRGSPQPFHKPTGTSGRMSPAVPLPLSPAMPPVRMGTPSNAGSGAVTPGAFNQPARPLSPGPKPQQRSMSPGPYGASGPKPMAGAKQRRRSNSASAANVRDRRNSPPGPSKLGPGPGIAL